MKYVSLILKPLSSKHMRVIKTHLGNGVLHYTHMLWLCA